MGKVYFDSMGSHKANGDRELIELQPEMLNWPCKTAFGYEEMEKPPQYLINALTAMFDIKLFEFRIGLLINTEKKFIQFYDHCFGYIFLKDIEIVNFVVGNKTNHSFHYLYQWPEIGDSVPKEIWSINDWKCFFCNEIVKSVNDKTNQAKSKFESSKKLCQSTKKNFYTQLKIEQTVLQLFRENLV